MNRDAPGAGVCFVIPTYEEALNIAPLLRRLAGLHPDADTVFLVVDDESPDGTARLVREAAASDGRVHLLEGPRRGFGRACVRGMAHALDALGAEVVVQMDADFSHDPADVRRLLARLGRGPRGADVAIGSRYVAGGSIDPRWSLGRRLLSRWGNRLARWIAGVRGIRDCTAGFKAIRGDVLRAANVEDLKVRGHAFQVVLLHRLLQVGARVVEEPIHFRDRARGEAKLGPRAVVEFFHTLWWLRLGSRRALVEFGLTGLLGVLVNLGSFYVLSGLGVHELLASPAAFELAIVSSYLTTRLGAFAGLITAGGGRSGALEYNLAALPALTLGALTFAALWASFPQAAPLLLQACGLVPAASSSYFMVRTVDRTRENGG